MAPRVSVMKGFVCLAVAVALLAGSGAWAAHDCCGHPPESSQAADPGKETSPGESDCACACCQGPLLTSSLTAVSLQFDPRWSIEIAEEFASSRVESDIFRPPLS